MDFTPTAVIYGSDNFITRELKKALGEKSLNVVLINNPLELLDDSLLNEKADYFFVVSGFEGFDISESDCGVVVSLIKKRLIKTEVILPYNLDNRSKFGVHETSAYFNRYQDLPINILYLGEFYDENFKFSQSGFVSNSYRKVLAGKSVLSPIYDIDLYLTDLKAAIEIMLRGMFSYGFKKREMVVAKKTSAYAFLTGLENKISTVTYEADKNIGQNGTVACFDFCDIDFSEDVFARTVSKFKEQIVVPNVQKKETPKPKPIKLKLNIFKKLKRLSIIAIALLWILAMPFLALVISVLILKVGIGRLNVFDTGSSKVFFEISKSFANFSNTIFVGFTEGKRVSMVVENYADAGILAGDALTKTKQIASNILSNGGGDINTLSDRLYLDVDGLWQKLSFILADINGLGVTKTFLPDLDLSETVNYLGKLKSVAKSLPQIFGSGSEKNYLVILQDNNEIRPAGGKITQFGLFTFKDGVLADKSFFTTQSTDTQLRGQVVPPDALKTYLKLKNWNFENSNWDPDFGISAQRAQWFLTQETGQSTDGVIGVNENLFNELQGFGGNMFDWMSRIIEKLNSKNVLIYFNDSSLEDAFKNVNWAGGVSGSKCISANCVSYITGLVDANLGGNKIDGMVNRSLDLELSFSPNEINSKAVVSFDNLSSETYKDYARMLGNGQGNYFEVTGKTSKNVTFRWSQSATIDFKKPGELVLDLRKQPGIEKVTYKVKVDTGNPVSYNIVLTTDQVFRIKW